MDFEHIVSVMLHYNYYCKQNHLPYLPCQCSPPPFSPKKKPKREQTLAYLVFLPHPLPKWIKSLVLSLPICSSTMLLSSSAMLVLGIFNSPIFLPISCNITCLKQRTFFMLSTQYNYSIGLLFYFSLERSTFLSPLFHENIFPGSGSQILH